MIEILKMSLLILSMIGVIAFIISPILVAVSKGKDRIALLLIVTLPIGISFGVWFMDQPIIDWFFSIP